MTYNQLLRTGPLGQSPYQGGLRGDQVVAAAGSLALPSQAQNTAGGMEGMRARGMTANTAEHGVRVAEQNAQAEAAQAQAAFALCCQHKRPLVPENGYLAQLARMAGMA